METSTAAPPRCSCPPGPFQRMSRSLPPGPSASGTVSSRVRSLAVAVPRALDRLGVHAERHVVDEHPPVDLGEVHPPLPAVDEGVERTDDVVAVDPEIEREVVARARRNAGVRQRALGGDRSHDGLRAVSPGHRQRVRTAFDRGPDERLEVVAPLQLDRLDPPRAASSARAKCSALPPPGLRVVEQHRPARGRGSRQVDVADERGAGQGQRDQQPRHQQQVDEDGAGRATRTRAPASASPATVRPTTRSTPRRSTPYQAAVPATTTHASTTRPRGNSLTATTTPSTTVAAPTTSAAPAATRRAITGAVRGRGASRIRALVPWLGLLSASVPPGVTASSPGHIVGGTRRAVTPHHG